MVEAGLPGRRRRKLPVRTSEHEWLTRLDENAVKEKLGAKSSEHRLDQVVLARRNTSRE
jgi:hypothetical protein